MNLEQSKDLVARRKGSLRGELPVEFPLTDDHGVFVIKDRRRKPDPRKTDRAMIRMKAIPQKKRGSMNRLIFISLIAAIDIAFILLVYALIVEIQS